MKAKKTNKRVIISLSLFALSLVIVIYQLKFSVSARLKENLDDFSRVETFLSAKVGQEDLENISREDGTYSFTLVEEEESGDLKEIGKVFMVDKNEDLVGDFLLYKSKGKYILYMRKLYMSID